MPIDKLRKAKRDSATSNKLKELIHRAIVDPKFRRKLFKNPKAELAKLPLSPAEQESIFINLDTRLKKMIDSIDDQIDLLSESVLCTNGPCGIA